MTSLPHHSPTDRPVIDWTNVRTEQDIADTVRALVTWMGSFQRKHNMQVYLPAVMHRASMRKLQHTLLLLGCTVTCRMQSVS